NPDGVTYLDIARALSQGEWGAGVNALWSPMYPALQAIALRLVAPAPRLESIVAHAVNVAIFAVALAAFEFFLRAFARLSAWRDGEGREGTPLARATWLAFAYAIFTWAALSLVSTAVVAPDMLVVAFAFVAFGLVARVRLGDHGVGTQIAVGAALAAGYWAKSSLFLLAAVFLVVDFLALGANRRALTRAAVAALAFAVVASPLVVALSRQKGRATFSDAGKLNYAMHVSRTLRGKHWQGETPGGGTPVHPTRKLLDRPPVFEFATPIGGTYPPWYDPSYWAEGVRAPVRVGRQLSLLVENTKRYFVATLPWFGTLALIVLVAAGHGAGVASWRSRLRDAAVRHWDVVLPSIAALGMYAIVHVEPRYVAPFLAALLLVVLDAVRLPDERFARRAAGALAVATVLATAAMVLAEPTEARARGVADDLHQRVAASLAARGVAPGARIALLGHGNGAYWAHLLGAKVVAEIPPGSESEFWSADAATRALALSAMQRAGARLVVAPSLPPAVDATGWERVADTGYYVRALSR
ncbi:MAG TPA: hypothetical protein VFJ74_03685, partial [Gemmatimonadaceae bacterium]|nr:hypothetical protein [Gemmatimonadaceae bacterium]